jgi:hypothetical protein
MPLLRCEVRAVPEPAFRTVASAHLRDAAVWLHGVPSADASCSESRLPMREVVRKKIWRDGEDCALTEIPPIYSRFDYRAVTRPGFLAS